MMRKRKKSWELSDLQFEQLTVAGLRAVSSQLEVLTENCCMFVGVTTYRNFSVGLNRRTPLELKEVDE